MWPREEAIQFFRERGEPLKVQLIEEKTAGQKDVSVYTIKDRDLFVDFCVGPHVPTSGRLKAFKLLNTSNAYWKGDARNQPMQRIYGTAFFSENELQAYLTRIEEAKKRDHRKLGRELGLFMFHPWAPGATFWLDKGTTLYNLLANYMRGVLFPAGYVEVKTPLVFNKALWETSGHWAHYRQNMFLIEHHERRDTSEQLALKAMNCPGHMLLFASEVRSYRDLPLRFHEQTPLHRNEASGTLSGLTRVRQSQPGRCALLRDAGADRRRGRAAARAGAARLRRLRPAVRGASSSTRPAEFLGEAATWDSRRGAAQGARSSASASATRSTKATARSTARRSTSTSPTRSAGNGSARRFSSTIRCPQRFDLKYIGADNTEHRAGRDPSGDFRQLRAVHRDPDRALRGRVSAVAGAGAGDRAADCRQACRVRRRPSGSGSPTPGLRVQVDERQEKIGYKIREAQLQKIPYMLVVGDREAAEGAVAVRSRSGGDLGSQPLDAFIASAREEVGQQGATQLAASNSSSCAIGRAQLQLRHQEVL